MKKRNAALVVVVVGSLGLLAAANLLHSFGGVNYYAPQLTYNRSDIRAVAGVFSDIFVGRVVKKIGTQDGGGGPVSTLYSVIVVDSLKGDAKGTVTVRQLGGYHNFQWTVIEGDLGEVSPIFDRKKLKESFLQPGETYLLVTSYSSEKDRYTMGWGPEPTRPLNIDSSATDAEARVAAAQDAYVKDMIEAIADPKDPNDSEKGTNRKKQNNE